MSRMIWDAPGARRYEYGVDRGVLYLPDNSGVPWNGLVSVDEIPTDIEVESFYFGGVKYLDVKPPGEYSASLKALTYPDEFLQFDGYVEIEEGMFLGNQPLQETFGLSYRTAVGNDTGGSDYGHKIHLAYNLTAKADTSSYATVSSSVAPSELGWTLTGIPVSAPGFRPTVHVMFDTTKIHHGLVTEIENLIYGGDSPARLPAISEFRTLVNSFEAFTFSLGANGVWTASSKYDDISVTPDGYFKIDSAPAEYVDENTYRLTFD